MCFCKQHIRRLYNAAARAPLAAGPAPRALNLSSLDTHHSPTCRGRYFPTYQGEKTGPRRVLYGSEHAGGSAGASTQVPDLGRDLGHGPVGKLLCWAEPLTAYW